MEDLIPIIAIICTIGLPVSAFMLFRVLSHRERMEMIRQGVPPQQRGVNFSIPQPSPSPPPSGMTLKQQRKSCKNNGEIEPPYVTLRKGIQLTMVGFALTVGLSFIGWDGGHLEPGPWLLGGLIPMFVGLAQVILALLSGASLTPLPQQQWTAGQQQSPPPFGGPSPGPTPAQQVYDNSYTYRPGDMHELQPPGSPPDRR